MHLAGALFDARAKTSMTHVPYKGGGPAIAALLGGEIQAMFSNTTLAMPHIRAAKLRALAVTGRTRLAALPEVPTLTESGVPGMEIDAGWFGLFAPAKTPVEIINRLHSEVRTALAKPAVRERLIEQGRCRPPRHTGRPAATADRRTSCAVARRRHQTLCAQQTPGGAE